MDDLEEQVYASIRTNVEANRRLEGFYVKRAPVELIMSIETVQANLCEIDKICARLRARETTMTRGTDGQEI
jgi:hypothetical protein